MPKVIVIAEVEDAARFEEGIPYFERALQLNPLDPNNQLYLTQLAVSHLCAGRYDKAVEYTQQAMEQGAVTGEYYPGGWVDVGTPERLQLLEAQLQAS